MLIFGGQKGSRGPEECTLGNVSVQAICAFVWPRLACLTRGFASLAPVLYREGLQFQRKQSMSAHATAPQTGEAFGRPGISPRWTNSNKDGIGTAYATSSRVWFTLSRG